MLGLSDGFFLPILALFAKKLRAYIGAFWLFVHLKGIVSRDFVVCFFVSFDRSDISTHQELVLLLLKVRFRIEFFDFRVRP
jgi:hypothetical protein